MSILSKIASVSLILISTISIKNQIFERSLSSHLDLVLVETLDETFMNYEDELISEKRFVNKLEERLNTFFVNQRARLTKVECHVDNYIVEVKVSYNLYHMANTLEKKVSVHEKN